ncbi:MAG: PadR family transcriptional regulator [Actinobacteria bacterium]|nr:PadR family transcriptional regulator [Actinomycetota bacterium]
MHHRMWGESRHHGPGRRGFFERGGIILVILDLLREQPRHGYDIIRELEERSSGFYSPSPGVVYPTLQSLEDRDFVTAATEAGGKKIYSITDAGLAWLDGHQEETKRYKEHMAAIGKRIGGGEWPGAMRDMKWFIGDVAMAMHRVAGDADKTREIREIIMDAKKRIDDIVTR